MKRYVFELKSCDFILHFLFIKVLAFSRVTDNVTKQLESDETKSERPE